MGINLNQISDPKLRQRILDAAHAQSVSKAQAKAISAPILEAEPKRKSRGMNKTESAFGDMLRAKVARGELVSYQYEGMKLSWSGMIYTPDFLAIASTVYENKCSVDPGEFPHVRMIFYEVKGAHIFSRDMVRFKGAKAQWPLFEFQMWQLKKGQWTRLH